MPDSLTPEQMAALIETLQQENAGLHAERETLVGQLEQARTGTPKLPSEAEAPQETKCRHGQDLQGGKGCEEKCKNTLCAHPCREHAMNCLHTMEAVVAGKKVLINCPCTGLSH